MGTGCPGFLQASLKEAVNQNWRRLKTEVRAYVSLHGTDRLALGQFLEDQQLELADIYLAGSGGNRRWVNLKRAAGLLEQVSPAQEEAYFSRRFSSLLHVDDVEQLQLLERIAEDPAGYQIGSDSERLRLQMLAYQVDSHEKQAGTAQDFLNRLGRAPQFKLHASYSRREVLTAVRFLTPEKRKSSREGVVRLHDRNTELMFVTLDKSDAAHEGVAYDDYAISPELFHWQSQNAAGPHTKAGRRYIQQGDNPSEPWSFQLFVQETKNHAFRACGPVTLENYRGGKPMNITWHLQNPLPPWLYEAFSVLRGQ